MQRMKVDTEIKALLEEGKRKGFVTYEEINRQLPDNYLSGSKLEVVDREYATALVMVFDVPCAKQHGPGPETTGATR